MKVNKQSEGVILYIHNSPNSVSVKTYIISNVDTIFIKNKVKSCRIVAELVYRPSGQTLDIDHSLSGLILGTSGRWEAIFLMNFNLPVQRRGEPLNS